jgi:hypothetical protein
MALQRFDLRKHLVLQEANAIGTTSYAPDCCPSRSAARFAHSSCNMCRPARPIRQRPRANGNCHQRDRTKALQSSLRQKAEEAARQSPTPLTAQFVTSLNDTIGLSEKRLTARKPHPRYYLAYAAADCSHGVLHVWLTGSAKDSGWCRRFAAR